jgi:predicted AAA+ superfamily ATPase
VLQDPKSFGFLFENLCIRDLRVYAQALDAEVFHYRDRNNLECDAVMHRKNGTYGLIEIKLGGLPAIDHGAQTLLELAGKIDTTKMSKPSFLMVLVGAGSCAYRRKDGVLVVPIGCLKP